MYQGFGRTQTLASGVSGTVTLPLGAAPAQIVFIGGTCAIFGGVAIPNGSTAPFHIRFKGNEPMSRTGAQTIVFAGTSSFFVEYFTSGNT